MRNRFLMGGLVMMATAIIFLSACQFRLTTMTRPDGAGTVDPESDREYARGAVVSLSAMAAIGWNFHLWEGDITGSSSTAEVVMDSDKSVTAVFIDNIYGKWANPTYNGSYTPGKVDFVFLEDGTSHEQYYTNDYDTLPSGESTYTLDAKWIDADGYTWYKLNGDFKGQHWYSLAKVNPAGNELIGVSDSAAYPTSIDPAMPSYTVYQRL